MAIVVLVITGAAMASHLHLWGDTTLQIKLGLVVLVGVLIHFHMRKPEIHVYRRRDLSSDPCDRMVRGRDRQLAWPRK